MHALKFFPNGDGVPNTPGGVTSKKYYTFPSRKFGWTWAFFLAIMTNLFYVK